MYKLFEENWKSNRCGLQWSLRIKWMCQRFKAFIRESIDGIICKTRLLKSYLINMTGFYVTIRWARLERCSPGSGFRLIRHIRVPSHLLGEWHLKISKLTNGAYYNNTWWFKAAEQLKNSTRLIRFFTLNTVWKRLMRHERLVRQMILCANISYWILLWYSRFNSVDQAFFIIVFLLYFWVTCRDKL